MNDVQFFGMDRQARTGILPRMLTPKEVAEWLQISVTLAYRMMKRGDIPSVPVKSLLRVSEEDLLIWMEKQKHTKRRQEQAADALLKAIKEEL